jgi:hypothetical protein
MTYPPTDVERPFGRDAADMPILLATIIGVDPFGDRARPGAGAAVLVLAAFLLSFAAIRASTRLARRVCWWPDGFEADGVHVHHLVLGITLMLLSGFLGFAAPLVSPWWQVTAIGFGVGAGLTLDEFALLVRLEDVYWAREGRASFDAVVCACAFAALVVLGTRPFGLDEPISIGGTALVAALVLALSIVAFAKGRVLLGVIGLFVPVVGLIAAVRLARPGSPWARSRYAPETLQRAQERFSSARPIQRLRHRIGDAVIGPVEVQR